ncbi:MAG: hypothetical protein HYS32_01465 [Candidatus Woesearchaeota archaeon]|nr:MAG: hypothetical protein HYS32_01465 [Candidatus Woesearchaeota archaeon]
MVTKYSLKRKLYHRGSSYEVTIPKPLLWQFENLSEVKLIFYKEKESWYITLEKEANGISKKIYRRGDSYETTLPRQMLFGLDLSKKYNVVFIPEKNRFKVVLENV